MKDNLNKYCKEYKGVKTMFPSNVRSIIRNLALNTLCLLDFVSNANKYLNKPRVQFLYIHHIFQDEEKKLDALLAKLKENHTFISYSEAVERVQKSDIDRPYITLSSDDGFKNNLSAIKILDKYGAKACFFINPAIVGVHDFEKITNYCKTRLNFPPVEFLTWEDIKKLQYAGHEIGSHAMSHINIADMSNEQVVQEITKSYEIIKSYCGEIKHFAYPYGTFSDFNSFAKKVVFDTGYVSCACAVRGCHIAQTDKIENAKLLIRRDHVILDWNIDHTMHFLIQSSRKASIQNNLFPESLQ